MTISFKTYQSEILALPHPCQKLFCCSCVEHVNPIRQYYCHSNEFRLALNKAWGYVRNSAFSIHEIKDLEKSITPLIPNIQHDLRIEADLMMKAGVMLLETFDCLIGESESAITCGSLVFDVLTVATHIAEDAVEPVPDFFQVPDKFSIESWLFREWSQIQSVLYDLATDKAKCLYPSWQFEQQRHGESLASEFLSKLRL